MVLGFLPLSKLRFVMFSIDARSMFDLWPFRFSFDGPQPIDVFRLLLQYFQLAKNDRNC